MTKLCLGLIALMAIAGIIYGAHTFGSADREKANSEAAQQTIKHAINQSFAAPHPASSIPHGYIKIENSPAGAVGPEDNYNIVPKGK